MILLALGNASYSALHVDALFPFSFEFILYLRATSTLTKDEHIVKMLVSLCIAYLFKHIVNKHIYFLVYRIYFNFL